MLERKLWEQMDLAVVIRVRWILQILSTLVDV